MATATAKQRAAAEALEAEREPDALEVPPQEVELLALQEQYPDDTLMLHIYRQGQHARDLELIDEIPFKMFKPMDLAFPPYNGGTFRVHARTDTGLAYNRMWKVQRKTQDAPVAAKAALGDADVVRLIDDRLERILTRIMPQTPPAPPVDPFVNMEKLAGIIKALQPVAPAVAAPVAAPSFMEQLVMFEKLQGIMKGLAPKESGGDDLGTVFAEKGMDIVTGLITAAQNQPRPAEPAQIALQPATPVEPATEDEDMIMMKMALRQACKAAKENKPVLQFAEMYYDLIPDDVLAQICDEPEWYQKLCELNPECSLHEPWFTALRAQFVEWFNAPGDDEGVDNAPETGQASPQSTNGDSVSSDGDIHPKDSGAVP